MTRYNPETGEEIDSRPIQSSPLFDGITQRDAAIEKVEAGADDEWLAKASAAVASLAAMRTPFTADDVWYRVEGSATRDPRALGAVILRAASAGKIRPTGCYIPSKIPSRHARPVKEWVGV